MAEFIKGQEGESPEGRAHREKANEWLNELYEAGGRDELTGLLNEKGMKERGKTEFARVHRTHHETYEGKPESLSVVFLDMNSLKTVNDTYGHAAGNAAIRAIADRIREIAHRGTDVAGRMHGDEFIVMLPDTLPEDAAKLFGDTVRAEAVFGQPDGTVKKVPVTAAVGIASYQPGDETLEAVMSRADRAMYQAKTAERTGSEGD